MAVVGDDDRPQPSGPVAVGEQPGDLAGAGGVERGGRLVEDEDLGVELQGRREGQALPLAAGKRLGVAVEPPRVEADLGQGARIPSGGGGPTRAARCGYLRLSPNVPGRGRGGLCATRAIRRRTSRTGRLASGTSPRRIVPSAGSSSRFRRRTSVLLPDPEAPRMTYRPPGSKRQVDAPGGGSPGRRGRPAGRVGELQGRGATRRSRFIVSSLAGVDRSWVRVRNAQRSGLNRGGRFGRRWIVDPSLTA